MKTKNMKGLVAIWILATKITNVSAVLSEANFIKILKDDLDKGVRVSPIIHTGKNVCVYVQCEHFAPEYVLKSFQAFRREVVKVRAGWVVSRRVLEEIQIAGIGERFHK